MYITAFYTGKKIYKSDIGKGMPYLYDDFDFKDEKMKQKNTFLQVDFLWNQHMKKWI